LKNKKMQKTIALSFVFVVLALMYVPILFLIIYSFTYTNSGLVGDWGGFDLRSYGYIFETERNGSFENTLLAALGNTLLIAVTSGLLAVLIGTVSAVGIFYLKRRMKATANTLNQIIVVNADIVTAVAFMTFFFLIGLRDYGLVTLIIAHTMITVPFVILTVSPRLGQLNKNLYDAGLDLGAGPMRTLFTVVMPQLIPSMLAAFAIAFTLSVDDFVVTYFNNGGAGGINTLSTYLYTSFKQTRVVQQLRALSSLIFILSFAILLFVNFRKKRKAKKDNSPIHSV